MFTWYTAIPELRLKMMNGKMNSEQWIGNDEEENDHTRQICPDLKHYLFTLKGSARPQKP